MRKGFSLAEVLVGAALSLLLFGLVFQIWSISSAGWRTLRARQDSQQHCLAPVSHLQQDFRQACPSSVQLQAVSQGWTLSFLTPAGREPLPMWDATGQILWRSWVQYRFAAAQKLVEKRQVLLDQPQAAVSGGPPGWPPDQKGRILARELYGVPTVAAGAGSLDFSVTVGHGQTSTSTRLRLLSQFYGND